jgi:ABC-2 type transport system permease protein
MKGFTSLSRAMFLGFVRDRSALFFTVLFPLMFLLLFGTLLKDSGTARMKVIEVGRVAVLDQLQGDGRAQVDKVLEVTRRDDAGAAVAAVRSGDYAAAIEQQGNTVVIHFSAADPVRANTVRSVMQALVQQANLAVAGTPPRLSLKAQQVEDHSLKIIQYITPSLLGWALATGATFGAAMTLVTWREKRILRRVRLAPVSPFSMVSARVGVTLAVALIQMAIFIGVASLPYFGLELSHYWWMSIPVVLVGTLAFLSIGLIVGARAKTQQAANGLAQLIVLPMAFLSGSFFSLDDAPQWLRNLAEIFPLRHLNTAMLDVMVRGKGPEAVLPELGILAGFAVVLSGIAALVFRWDDV